MLKAIYGKVMVIMGLIFMAMITMGNAWNPDVAESNIRSFFGNILLIIAGWRILKNYNDGKKGSAIMEGLVAGVLGLFIGYPEIINSFGGWVRSLMGF